MTVEDPIEYDLDGISQTQVNAEIEMSFARALRTILRQDPDVVMIGEIRDLETAQIAVQASLTGHLVFATLHTNDAVSAVTRLVDMGVEPFLLASSLIGVVAQRLVRQAVRGMPEGGRGSSCRSRLRRMQQDRVSRPQRHLRNADGRRRPAPADPRPHRRAGAARLRGGARHAVAARRRRALGGSRRDQLGRAGARNRGIAKCPEKAWWPPTSSSSGRRHCSRRGPCRTRFCNSANFSSIATDAKGVIQIFNVGAERMLGYAAADVMNKITPADISDPQEVIARAKALSVELGTPITPGFEALVFKASRGIEDIYELTYIRKDGSRFPAVVSVTALRDAQDAIIGYLLIGTDNTARKQAEEALLKAGALQSAIFNSANFSSIATDAKGVIQIFNVGAERMLGYAAADVMNKITPADISDPQEVIARAKALSVELGTPITPGFEALVFKASRGIEDIYELTYIRKDGSRFPAVVSVTALRDAQDAIIGYLLIGTDNTARKQVEAEQKKLDQRLRDQQFYTRSLIESNIDALMTTDPSGIITDVNKQMEVLTGCTRDELIGAPFKNYFTDPERAEAGIKLVLSEKKVTDYELTARARDGKKTVVSYNATTFYDRDRKLQGVFAAARDVTERKRFEQALPGERTSSWRAPSPRRRKPISPNRISSPA